MNTIELVDNFNKVVDQCKQFKPKTSLFGKDEKKPNLEKIMSNILGDTIVVENAKSVVQAAIEESGSVDPLQYPRHITPRDLSGPGGRI